MFEPGQLAVEEGERVRALVQHQDLWHAGREAARHQRDGRVLEVPAGAGQRLYDKLNKSPAMRQAEKR
jgi:hypothetical protein